MKTQFTPDWYKAKTSNGQGLIIDEKTGRNVAVSYQEEDAFLIAVAPELYRACKKALALLNHMTTEDYSLGKDRHVRKVLEEALSKAEMKGEGE